MDIFTFVFLCQVSDKAPLEKVCLLGCGISTGYGAALNTAKVKSYFRYFIPNYFLKSVFIKY